MAPRILELIPMKCGTVAEASFLSERDSVRELRRFINAFVEEGAMLTHDRKATLKEEAAWKKSEISKLRKREGYVLVARIGGKIAATSSACRDRGNERDNVVLGIAVAAPYRGKGLGEALLRLNIKVAKRMLRPRNTYLHLFAVNNAARSLYRKIGFREFAVFPGWIRYRGRYVDRLMMKL